MKKVLLLSLLLLSFAVVLTGCGVLQEVEEPSATLEAVPVEVDAPEVAAEPTDSVNEAVEEVESTEEEPISSADSGNGVVVYAIATGESTVRFELDEDLRGERITVVGTTDQIAGELAFDWADLSTAQVGEMRINARTLATDNNFRNRAINNEILDTGAYEFMTFVPTSIDGLPDSAAVGDAIEFTITGDLTIRDITNSVTFDVVATAVSEDQVTGTASTTIMRGDYGLQIPSVPNVANVEEEVDLYIDFVANAK